MHKKLLNELRLNFRLKPEGPLLIKSGQEAGANPALLDMNFVRTHHAELGETVYLPGSSLKGAIRSYCEKIGRSVGLVAICNPLGPESCGRKLEYLARTTKKSAEIYQRLCPICRIFGHTVMASHLHLDDAYPTLDSRDLVNQTEERDGVAIDRVSGAVAVGPFQLEVVTRGEFAGGLTLRNFQLWQVGLLAVALRDLGTQRLPLGFARSRGLGRVSLNYDRLEISYPGQFGPSDRPFEAELYGISSLLAGEEVTDYGYYPEPALPLPQAPARQDDWGRLSLVYSEAGVIEAFFKASVAPWASYVRAAAAGGGV